MEVYIDDMLVKSKQRQDHVTHLQQVFDLLREYGMKLNPLKCAFHNLSWAHEDRGLCKILYYKNTLEFL